MRVLQIGNFQPTHSTENHLRRALENNGHKVTWVQENESGVWRHMDAEGFDFVLWTRTGWDYTRHGYTSHGDAMYAQVQFLRRAHHLEVPVVSYHLDIWHGLNREEQLEEPFFYADLVVTADGGHEKEFAEAGINHVWFPPGVSRDECELGMWRDEYHSKIAFVGSWQGSYHKEHEHRAELVHWLQKNYRRDCAFWPKEGRPAVRGEALRDLYASVDVVVGDSCFAGKIKNYWSDRIPETLGRGGFLLHPYVEGLSSEFLLAEHDEPVTYDTSHLMTWEAGDFEELQDCITWALGCQEERRAIAKLGREHVLEHHTYERRMEQLVDLLHERGLLHA